MKKHKLIIILFVLGLVNYTAIYAQVFTKEVVINNVVFKVQVKRGDDDKVSTLILQRLIDNKKIIEKTNYIDSIYIHNWSKQLFSESYDSLLNSVSDTSFYAKVKNDTTFWYQIFNEFNNNSTANKYNIQTDILYGLSDDQIKLYKSLKIKLKQNQEKFNIIKRYKSLESETYDTTKDDSGKDDSVREKKVGLKKYLEFKKKIDFENYENVQIFKNDKIDKNIKEFDFHQKEIVYRTFNKLVKKDLRGIQSKIKYAHSFIADANVVSSFKTLNRSQLNAGFGLIAAKPGWNEFMGVITVAQTNDTIVSNDIYDFGQSVLIPGVRRFSILTSFRQYSIDPNSGSSFFRKLGWGINFNTTPYIWRFNNGSSSIHPDSVTRVIPFYFDLLFPYTWLHEITKDKDIAISTDIGITARYIGGDINAKQMENFLGTSKVFYLGAVVGFNLKYNALRAQFYMPLMYGPKVPGFTGGQAFASIGIVGSIINDFSKIFDGK